MSITDTNIQKLIINRLTQEKYDELLSLNQINDNELYITDTNDDSYSKPETDELLAQKADIQAVYTKDETDGFFTEIDDKINAITIPTNVSELNNDLGYITNIPNEYITETELNDKGYLTEHQDITGKADITYLNERLELKSDKSDTYTKDEVNSLLENIEVSGGSLPNQIDNEGKFLSTNGSTAEWSSIGKFSDTIDSIDIDLNRVVINRLTQAQYDELSVNGQLKEDEIYVTDTVPYTKEEVDELLNAITIPTNISELNNDIGYITQDELSNQYVDTTTDQDISGLKTFLNEELVIRNNNMQFNVAPSSRQESRFVFADVNNKPMTNVCCVRYADGSTFLELHTHAQNNAWSQSDTCLRFGHNGTRFLAEVPNPTADSNSREIATTSWVMQKIGDIGNILDTINGEII